MGAGPTKFFLRPIEQRGLDLQPRERRFAVAGCEFGVLLPRHFRQRSVHLRHHIFGDEAHLLARHFIPARGVRKLLLFTSPLVLFAISATNGGSLSSACCNLFSASQYMP